MNKRKPQYLCSNCGTKIKVGEAYIHDEKMFCDDCCMNARTVRTRKSHWQYLRSIKKEYLNPGKKG
jgi:hypothetical protein